MRIDEQVAEIETATDSLIEILRKELANYTFSRIGNRLFQDVGRIYEKRGAPAALYFIQSKIKDSRREERPDYSHLLTLTKRISESKLDINLKGFIIRKLPTILPEFFSRQGGQR